MTLMEMVKRTEKLVINNSPAILTALGVTGTITVAFLTGKATFKAAELIADEEYRIRPLEKNHPLDNKEKFLIVWKAYIPAAGAVVLTIVCVVYANRIGNRRAAAIAAAYSLSEKAFTEYKEKVVEKLGEHKERAVRDELAQDRVNRNPSSEHEVVITGNGEVLCYDAFTGRYFKSDMETLKKAQNDTNYLVLNDSYASLSDFYNKIDLPTTSYSDEVGWNTDKLLELNFSTCLSEDGKPCISIDFVVAPVRNYYKSN